jgi:predicted phosphodiesterase
MWSAGGLTKESQTFSNVKSSDIRVFGHTHRPKSEWLGGTLLFNPGSAGPTRFTLPGGIGLLILDIGRMAPISIALG